MGKEIEKIIGDYKAFFSDSYHRLSKVGIPIKDMPLIQFLYRTSTVPEYEGIRDRLKIFCREYVETDFNGRSVAILILKEPLELEDGFTVDMMELAGPRAAHIYPSGLESFGIFVQDSASFKKKYQKILTGVKDHGTYCKPAFITFDNGKTVKFYDITLKEIILREGWYFERLDLPKDDPINTLTTLINSWQHYLKNNEDWESLIKDIPSKQTACGPVYELLNPLDRPNESFAVADMRSIKVAEPHYHVETEIYFVLQGEGKMVVREQIYELEKDSAIVVPPNHSHFTIPYKDLVIALVNTPPFAVEHYIVLTESNKEVGFDKKQFEELTKGL